MWPLSAWTIKRAKISLQRWSAAVETRHAPHNQLKSRVLVKICKNYETEEKCKAGKVHASRRPSLTTQFVCGFSGCFKCAVKWEIFNASGSICWSYARFFDKIATFALQASTRSKNSSNASHCLRLFAHIERFFIS